MAKDKGEGKMTLIFSKVVKEIGEGEAKQTLTLKYDPITGRFDLHKDDYLVTSSSFLGDCILAAKSYGVIYSEEEKKITFKVAK